MATQCHKILDYKSAKVLSGSVGPVLATICAIVTLVTSFAPIWLDFAHIWMVPSYIGWLMMLMGIRPLWKLRRWGILCVLVGSIFTLIGLVFRLAMIASLVSSFGWFAVRAEALADTIVFLAASSNVSTIVLLILKLKSGENTTYV
jgi:hypothetical protein